MAITSAAAHIDTRNIIPPWDNDRFARLYRAL
jgi:hypothetical protein